MKEKYAFVTAVLLLGYSLYGVPLLIASGTGLQAASSGPTIDVLSPGDTQATTENSSSDVPFRFRPVSAETGYNYTYRRSFSSNLQTISNAGVFAADYDGDGWTDVLAIGGERPVLFENRGGEFHRTDVLPEVERTVRSALFFDYDMDSSLELLLLANDRPPLLLNWNGDSYTPVDAGFERPLAEPIGATTADYNSDGCPDLFVVQYGNWSENLPTGNTNYSAPFNRDNGAPDRIYYGNCSSFDSAADVGVRGTRWSLATSSADFDNDGDIDIHVANDFNYDVVYWNRGDGTFEQVRLSERTNRNGMSSEVGDTNGDGRLDVFVTNIYYPDFIAARTSDVLKTKANGNNLLVNRGDRQFDEVANRRGVYKGGWGWAAVLTDFDNDGDEDLFHTTRRMNWTERERQFPDDAEQYLAVADRLPYYSWPVVWQNDGRGFRSVSSSEVGFETANGRGVARLDYNRDGAIDLVVATTDGYRLYENTGADGRALQVHVRDENGTRAIGARVYLLHNGTATQWRSVRAFTDFLSQDAGVVHFGTGDAETVSLRVEWLDGPTRYFTDVRTDRRLVVRPSGIVGGTPLAPRNATGTGPQPDM
jgi:hypothetical protein